MNRRLLCIGLIAALVGGCEAERRVNAALAPQTRNLAEENARLQRELEETKRKLELQGQYTADATRTLNELQDHLSRISSLEGEIRGGTEGNQPLTKSRRERMITAIQQMEAEVDHQRRLVADFRQREEQYTEKVADLSSAITRFERLIETKNAEIERLRVELHVVKSQVETLTEDRKVKERELARQREALDDARWRVETLEREARAAGYIVGPIRGLRRAGIIVEKRVLLSRVWVVSPNLDPDKLEPIDIAEWRQLSIVAPRNKIVIVSPHPPDAYTLVPESATQTLLTITDPDRFWTTRYLVVGIR